MKEAYPIILKKGEKYIVVEVPDFDISTQANSIVEAIEMARDAIAMLGLSLEEENRSLPRPSSYEEIATKKDELKTLVDVDFADYKRKLELKTVKKNCTLPSWLCYEAEKNGINFSAVLQEALKERLGVH